MEVTVKVRYGCSKSMIENFGNNRYLVYLLSLKEDGDAMAELKTILSRNIGIPAGRIELKRETEKELVFII